MDAVKSLRSGPLTRGSRSANLSPLNQTKQSTLQTPSVCDIIVQSKVACRGEGVAG